MRIDKKPVDDALLIWDRDGVPEVGEDTTVLWRSYDTGGREDVVSIPKLVEDSASSLRARYLAWIYDLGETKVRRRRIVDHLELRPGFSYWWMSLLTEKCNFAKSPQINDAIRLMAFCEWVQARSITRIVMVSANHPLVKCIRLWCANLGVAFELRRMAVPTARLSWAKRIYQAVPPMLQALAWLPRYLFDRWPSRGAGLREWQQTDGRVTFFSYSDNWLPSAVMEGRYASRYWAHLPEALQCESCKTNWLHLYVKDQLLPSSKQVAETIRLFNKTRAGEQFHVTLDTFLSLKVVFHTLVDWLRLGWKGVSLRQELSSKMGSVINLWPLFEDEWRQSTFGVVAMENLLNLNMFESALECLPLQQRGVYMQENQGWEFGLIQAWQAAGHGHLIGTPHSTVRYWDLRYFFDPRSYHRTGSHDLPLPSKVAVNGLAVWNAYRDSGYPTEDLVEVEALRYLHLCDAEVKVRSAPASKNTPMRVLVLGDYLSTNTQRQMSLLVQAVESLPVDTVITVKPHPNYPIRMADYPSIRFEVTMEPIAKLLSECDVAYSSAVTSAAVDAYCAGVPIVSLLDPNIMNLSPLRGCLGALFASTSEDLAKALRLAATTPRTLANQHSFFTLDPGLPRWRKLLMESSTR